MFGLAAQLVLLDLAHVNTSLAVQLTGPSSSDHSSQSQAGHTYTYWKHQPHCIACQFA